eukprot:2357255-Rhodomonas_salina.3
MTLGKQTPARRRTKPIAPGARPSVPEGPDSALVTEFAICGGMSHLWRQCRRRAREERAERAESTCTCCTDSCGATR